MCKSFFPLAFIFFGVLTQAMPSPIGGQRESVKLRKDKPGVFISFVRFGNQEPLEVGESDQRIWLRLDNNTRWKIWFPSFGVPKEYGGAGIYYDVERFPTTIGEIHISPDSAQSGSAKPGVAKEPPTGYSKGDNVSYSPLAPGKSVLFSVPREHLASELFIRISFFYDWEKLVDVVTHREPEHFVYFFSSSLPVEQKQQNR